MQITPYSVQSRQLLLWPPVLHLKLQNVLFTMQKASTLFQQTNILPAQIIFKCSDSVFQLLRMFIGMFS